MNYHVVEVASGELRAVLSDLRVAIELADQLMEDTGQAFVVAVTPRTSRGRLQARGRDCSAHRTAFASGRLHV